MSRRGLALVALVAALMLASKTALACEDGQTLVPGESCDVTVKWGHDHWIKAELPEGGGHHVEFRHLEGGCKVSLFSPVETEGAELGPDEEPGRGTQSGEYHLFTRAIVVAKQACRYRVTVN
ncbi:MAG: hypothetical protein MI920_36290 [Kiloniellales bacterium]|nr:hypothetical protein [Kiloniellales bacterium]